MVIMMTRNKPEVLAEVTAAFAAYEDALVNNKVDVLDQLFMDAEETIRYGATENLYGIAEIRAFRAARSSIGLERDLQRTVITTYGDAFATAMTEFARPAFYIDGKLRKIGRQSQTWIKTDQAGYGGWRVVAAHVSIMTLPE